MQSTSLLPLTLLLLSVGMLVSAVVPPYMDEVFHVGQFVKFIDFLTFKAPFVWDPAITTFPGLYLVSLILLAPLLPFISNETTLVFCLRSVNFFFVNLALVWVGNKFSKHLGFLLVFFPLNFFYSFLYYTDPLATVSLLICGVLHKEGKFKSAGIAGIVAVLARQTNIVWLFALSLSTLLEGALTSEKMQKLWIQIATGVAFSIFVLYNKSVVLGHHQHHSFSLHFAQINYFILTATVLLLVPLQCSLKGHRSVKLFFLWLLYAGFAAVGTVTHPFILSDNRHYSFYFYKRIVEYKIFRILLIPAICASATLSKQISSKQILFYSCVGATLIPTPLLEFRYFALPCSILLLDQKPKRFVLPIYMIINIIILGIFIFRPFLQSDGQIARFMY